MLAQNGASVNHQVQCGVQLLAQGHFDTLVVKSETEHAILDLSAGLPLHHSPRLVLLDNQTIKGTVFIVVLYSLNKQHFDLGGCSSL